MSKLEILKDGLLLDGEPFLLVGGDFHYFRTLKTGWRKRLELMKDFGLTAVQVYVPWSYHEPKEGNFDFSGNLDLDEFLSLVEEYGMKIMLRPSPYICAEVDFGAMPWWLLKNPDICFRCMDDTYIAAVDKYYDYLCKIIVPHLSTNGGGIIAVALENEYGSYGNDFEYIRHLQHKLEDNGVDVPFYTCDGDTLYFLKYGMLKDIWSCMDYRWDSKAAFARHRELQPQFVPYASECWTCANQRWDEPQIPRDLDEVVRSFKDALEDGGMFNFYMFAGGTNFGFTSGAARFGKYRPFCTSYDMESPITEYGALTEKYFACRDVLDDFLNKPRRPHIYPKYEAQHVSVDITEYCDLLDNIDVISSKTVESVNPKPMEYLDQGYGFILYSTTLNGPVNGKEVFKILELHDRATLYLDGKYLGTMYRDRVHNPIAAEVDEGTRLDILVENFGRLNFTEFDTERKGILVGVTLGDHRIYHWKNRCLPMDETTQIPYSKIPKGGVRLNRPAFYRGFFDAKQGVDTFVDTVGWTKGFVRINGFNLGRYWRAGPQRTLYLPGELLKEKDNCIEFFDIHNPNLEYRAELLDRHILTQPTSETDTI